MSFHPVYMSANDALCLCVVLCCVIPTGLWSLLCMCRHKSVSQWIHDKLTTLQETISSWVNQRYSSDVCAHLFGGIVWYKTTLCHEAHEFWFHAQIDHMINKWKLWLKAAACRSHSAGLLLRSAHLLAAFCRKLEWGNTFDAAALFSSSDTKGGMLELSGPQSG